MRLRASSWAVAVATSALLGCGPTAKKQAAEPIPPPPRYSSGPAVGPEPILAPSAPHKEWLEDVHARLHDRWLGFTSAARTLQPPNHPLNRADLIAVVSLTVNLDGSISASELKSPSGISEFDSVVMEIIGEVSPLPPPPASAVSDDGRVYLTWTFARDPRQDSPVSATVEQREFDVLSAARAFVAQGRIRDALARLSKALDQNAPLTGTPEPEALAASRVIAAAVIERRAREGEPFDRMQAIRALGEGGVSSSGPMLEKMLADPDAKVRGFAAEALGALGHQPAAPALTTLAKTADGSVSVAAAQSLAQMGAAKDAFAEIAGDLASQSKPTPGFIRTVAALGDERATPWLTGLASVKGGAPPSTRNLAAAALAEVPLDDPAVRVLLSMTGSKGGADSRVAALSAFAAHGGDNIPLAKSVVFVAVESLKDSDPAVRAAAVRAALAIGRAKAVKDVAKRIPKDKVDDVKEALAIALSELGASGGAESVKMLKELAMSTHEFTRAAAMRGLIAVGEADALPAFDDSAQVRIEILRGVPARAEQALADPDAEVRAAAVAITAAKGDRLRAARAFTAELEGEDGLDFAAAWLRGTRS